MPISMLKNNLLGVKKNASAARYKRLINIT